MQCGLRIWTQCSTTTRSCVWWAARSSRCRHKWASSLNPWTWKWRRQPRWEALSLRLRVSSQCVLFPNFWMFCSGPIFSLGWITYFCYLKTLIFFFSTHTRWFFHCNCGSSLNEANYTCSCHQTEKQHFTTFYCSVPSCHPRNTKTIPLSVVFFSLLFVYFHFLWCREADISFRRL